MTAQVVGKEMLVGPLNPRSVNYVQSVSYGTGDRERNVGRSTESTISELRAKRELCTGDRERNVGRSTESTISELCAKRELWHR